MNGVAIWGLYVFSVYVVTSYCEGGLTSSVPKPGILLIDVSWSREGYNHHNLVFVSVAESSNSLYELTDNS